MREAPAEGRHCHRLSRAMPPQTAALLIKALEPTSRCSSRSRCSARTSTCLPIWRTRPHPHRGGAALYQVGLSRAAQRAASILQPDIAHVGGIFEGRLIAGMAEAYYAAIAPHCRWALWPWQHACSLTRPRPTFWRRNRSAWARAISSSRSSSRTATSTCPPRGLGIELDEALADKIGHDWTNPQTFHPDDGTAVDW